VDRSSAAPGPEIAEAVPERTAASPKAAVSETLGSEGVASEAAAPESGDPEADLASGDLASDGPVLSDSVSADLTSSGVPPSPQVDIVNTAAPEPAGEPLRAQVEPEAAALPAPANDTTGEIETPHSAVSEPAVRPILVGAGGEPPGERKRGWWRR
jgi:hypothetical protein